MLDVILLLLAIIIALGLWRKENMWGWIVAYWVVVVLKNL